ncbi:hypothetical protein HDU87_007188 [Geranomyces variabilis]|uniref:G protein gamma domain-containing protein n=2 Tax=Powellomycetaceae TaxID=1134080 RepID=A0A507EBY4_9FUNG|nr:hypothetical protein BDZ88DRAFT_412023 [Geranomyces variabilis]KAI8920347.1 hypothetical protein DFJ77DRAFT_452254 [Powellomyces hirtus]KAJ3134909.1 hypothetical protein HDU90_004234 [Geranomyces variabilis]KAJ3146536.1 hypothetical protein HDU89_006221 [Geranomyces variabilis]KAJ3165437.1 hypothetical protein HDU88_004234 [Geranomyces variabilis]
MSELKLQKLLALNDRLKLDEELPRVKVSEASKALMTFITATSEPLTANLKPEDNPFTRKPKGGGCTVL